MARIYIDTGALRELARTERSVAGRIGDINLDLLRGVARTLPPPVELLGQHARIGAAQARVTGLATALHLDAAKLDVHASLVEAAESGSTLSVWGSFDSDDGWDAASAVHALLEGDSPLDPLAAIFGGLVGGLAGQTIELSGEMVGVLADALKGCNELRSAARSVTTGVQKLPNGPWTRFLGVVGVVLAFRGAQKKGDDFWIRQKPDRPDAVEKVQDALEGYGEIWTGMGAGIAMVPKVGWAAGAVAGLIGTGIKGISYGVDAGYYLKAHGSEAWSQARRGWEATANTFVRSIGRFFGR